MADAIVPIKIAFDPALEVMAAKFGLINIVAPIQDELNKILFRIESYGKQLAPVGTPESTHKKGYVGGRLRASIHTSPLQGLSGIGGMVSTNTDYAFWVHDGTRKMRARPFLQTAANLVEPNMQGLIRARLDEEFTRAFKTL